MEDITKYKEYNFREQTGYVVQSAGVADDHDLISSCKAFISDLRKDAPKGIIKEYVNKIDSKFMRWGLMHSFKEGYTAKTIENMIKNTNFKKAQIKEEGINMQIILTK